MDWAGSCSGKFYFKNVMFNRKTFLLKKLGKIWSAAFFSTLSSGPYGLSLSQTMLSLSLSLLQRLLSVHTFFLTWCSFSLSLSSFFLFLSFVLGTAKMFFSFLKLFIPGKGNTCDILGANVFVGFLLFPKWAVSVAFCPFHRRLTTTTTATKSKISDTSWSLGPVELVLVYSGS